MNKSRYPRRHKRCRIIYRASMRTKSGKVIFAADYGLKAFIIKIYY